MIEFKSYFSGSSGNLYSVSDGKTTLMLDCGVPWKEVQRSFKFKTSQVSGLLLGHGHGDHSKAVKNVAKAGIDIYLSGGTLEEIGVNGHRFHVVSARKQFSIGSFTILPFDVKHDSAEPLGFLVASSRDKLLFVIDANYVPYRFNGLTMIALGVNYDINILKQNIRGGHIDPTVGKRILCGHMSIQTAIGLLKANDLSSVREIHLLHLSRDNSNADQFKKEIQQLTGVPVYVAPA